VTRHQFRSAILAGQWLLGFATGYIIGRIS